MSRGCNSLLEKGSHPYLDFDTFVRHDLKIQPQSHRHRKLSPGEQLIVDQLKQGMSAGDQIAKGAHIDIALFNQLITLLEMKGVVNALGCNQWALV